MPVDLNLNVTIRPPKRPAPSNYSDRAQARMIRQKLIEQEQEIEDREALKVTAEELRILRDSFSSVKAEFTDLDGLSWDTPTARQVLLNWHAQQAALRDELRLGDLAHRMRRAGHSSSPRRSLASIMCPPGLSASAPDLSGLSSTTVHHDDDAYDSTATVRSPGCSRTNAEAFQLTIRVRAHVGATSKPDASPTPNYLTVLTHNENERVSLPALFETVPREYADVALTPQPHRLSFDLDSVANPEPSTPVPTLSALPKSHSAPCVPFAGDAFLRSCSPSRLPELHEGDASTKSERPIKRLPPSRIPIPRSKSLGATSSARLAARCFSASAALPASASVPTIPSRAHPPRSLSDLCPLPESPTRSPHRASCARKSVPALDLDLDSEAPPRTPLGNSPTLNRGSDSRTVAALGFEDPASPSSPSTKLYPLSPAHRGRVGYNYRPAPQRVAGDRS
ncbi:hypothetical protein GSI_03511 [Ganoderma sinense ZZ0214-1]|uniref:Uncharacterized protein n=1 Tax=Ganoderma sinense ZZ0214-1 TaxID=1077348 RepID=A0A2G8SLW0_9APHY|nr:hypothetical protein GSI_03511 [Ganoderma sinense ZZ0214-1]